MSGLTKSSVQEEPVLVNEGAPTRVQTSDEDTHSFFTNARIQVLEAIESVLPFAESLQKYAQSLVTTCILPTAESSWNCAANGASMVKKMEFQQIAETVVAWVLRMSMLPMLLPIGFARYAWVTTLNMITWAKNMALTLATSAYEFAAPKIEALLQLAKPYVDKLVERFPVVGVLIDAVANVYQWLVEHFTEWKRGTLSTKEFWNSVVDAICTQLLKLKEGTILHSVVTKTKMVELLQYLKFAAKKKEE